MYWYKGLIIVKDPDAEKTRFWNWLDWLSEGDAIVSHEVIATEGINIDDSQIQGSGVIVKLSGGTAGNSYDVTVRVITASGEKDDRTVTFQVEPQ